MNNNIVLYKSSKVMIAMRWFLTNLSRFLSSNHKIHLPSIIWPGLTPFYIPVVIKIIYHSHNLMYIQQNNI